MDELPLTIFVQHIPGKGRGKKIGIPTLNFKIPKSLNLEYGIYAGYLINQNTKHRAAIHFGPRPQFNETDPSLEAYLVDGEIKKLENKLQLQFVKFIRETKAFPQVSAMLEQIESDIKIISTILSQT